MTEALSGRDLMVRQTSMPLMSGRLTSSKTRSGDFSAITPESACRSRRRAPRSRHDRGGDCERSAKARCRPHLRLLEQTLHSLTDSAPNPAPPRKETARAADCEWRQEHSAACAPFGQHSRLAPGQPLIVGRRQLLGSVNHDRNASEAVSALSSSRTSKPLRPGITRSSRIRAGRSKRALSAPSAALAASMRR